MRSIEELEGNATEFKNQTNNRLMTLESQKRIQTPTTGTGLMKKELKIKIDEEGITFQLVSVFGGGVFRQAFIPFGETLAPFNKKPVFSFNQQDQIDRYPELLSFTAPPPPITRTKRPSSSSSSSTQQQQQQPLSQSAPPSLPVKESTTASKPASAPSIPGPFSMSDYLKSNPSPFERTAVNGEPYLLNEWK
jgi:hypothetical protein